MKPFGVPNPGNRIHSECTTLGIGTEYPHTGSMTPDTLGAASYKDNIVNAILSKDLHTSHMGNPFNSFHLLLQHLLGDHSALSPER